MKSGPDCVKQWHPNFSDPKMLERIFKAFVEWQEMQLVIWQRQGEMLDLTTRFLTSKTFFITLPPKVSTFISGRWRSLQPVQTQLDLSTVFTRLNALHGGKIVSKSCPRKNTAPNPLRRLFEDYKKTTGNNSVMHIMQTITIRPQQKQRDNGTLHNIHKWFMVIVVSDLNTSSWTPPLNSKKFSKSRDV